MDLSSREGAARYLAEVVAEDSAGTADRRDATKHLVELQRDRWPEVTRTLRLMLTLPLAKPRDHLLVIDGLATLKAIRGHERTHMVLAVANDPTATAQDRVAGLRAITQNPASGPTIRWHAAHALILLRRDLRDEAALVVRDVVRRTDIPSHIRWRAARALARLSATCRDEAREILDIPRSIPW